MPESAASHMQLGDGMRVELIACEPLVRQPVAMDFDDRGRLWVMQYLQYPNPAELQRTQVDRYSRTQYDRIPTPPPNGPKGADRLTILTDSDGDCRMDTSKDFVDGLNLASGFAFGHDGVFVLNVPYLLYYADRDRNDVPDGPPDVLLQGFGMEDAHSVANSLTWGPDGWLYGCQGSTVTANIRGIEFQQGVWRYHPALKKFELFCEGGGNAWGLDFDRDGNLLYSTNYGGHVFVHGVQGGYFVKSFAKHGALHNPFAYGYFEHASHENFKGGHVTVGGMVYQADMFPQWRDKYIAGDLLGHNVLWHSIHTAGSTFRTAHGGELLRSNDTWFAPTDLTIGPEGAIYISDWHDARTAHPDPDAQWDRTNGRIYRITSDQSANALPNQIDLRNYSETDLIAMHRSSNQWMVRRARQELIRRMQSTNARDLDAVNAIVREALLRDIHSRIGLEQLSTLYCLGGIDEKVAFVCLESNLAAMRMWTIRLLGETTISDDMAHRLDEIAEREPDITVRAQLASTAARLPARHALPIVNANINRDCDNEDARMPLLWWWAIEKHCLQGRDEVLRRFLRPTIWKSKLGSEFLMPRLVRRYASENSQDGIASICQLLDKAPNKSQKQSLWNATLLGLRSVATNRAVSEQALKPLVVRVKKDGHDNPDDMTLLRLALLLDDQDAFERCLAEAGNTSNSESRRSEFLGLLVGKQHPDLLQQSLIWLSNNQIYSEPFTSTTIRVLSKFDNIRVPMRFIEMLGNTKSTSSRSLLVDVLFEKEEWAKLLLEQLDRGRVETSVATIDQVRHIASFHNPSLNAIVSKHWGKFESATHEEKLAEVRRLNNDLRADKGDADRGKPLFQTHCGNCHTLFGEGKKIGPDLTSANRQDRDYLLVSLVDPSSVIRKEYLSTIVATTDGRTIHGLPTQNDDNSVTLVTIKNETVRVPRTEISEMKESQISIMPADLYRAFKPHELRDLFAYLQGKP